ncbi:MAG: hypothetical protein ACQGVK_14885 [Myxococcota bacterium]
MRPRRFAPGRRALALWLSVSLVGVQACVSTPYEFGRDLDTELTLQLNEGESQIERGRPNAFLDGIGHYLISLPSKILLLSWSLNNHDISDETQAELEEYLEANDLGAVKVRLNQYDPGGEWSRLARNREMPAGWRWSLGLLSLVVYTILPGRFFAGLLGGDNYNPYTNTINLYSDNVPVALHEAGHAKDFAAKTNRHWKGGYAALRLIPGVPLWQEAVASNDAISFLYATENEAGRRSAYRKLYPAYGTYVGATGWQYGQFFPIGPPWVEYAIVFGPVAVGHVVGQTRALFVREREGPAEEAAEDAGEDGEGDPEIGTGTGASAPPPPADPQEVDESTPARSPRDSLIEPSPRW